jgi:divalent metal cation (Fe/Co/Zn/Cd) transporter
MDGSTFTLSNGSRSPLQRGVFLVVATMIYNSIESLVAIWSGWAAGSIALVGFGLDSIIELAAAGVLLWRLKAELKGIGEEEIETREQKVQRFVGLTFFLLAAYVLIEAISNLLGGQNAEKSLIGIILAILSLIIMPFIAWGKFKVANQIESAALRAEAKETLACAYLSFALLLGLGANELFGFAWADPVAALAMVPWLIKEGFEGINGDSN